MPQGLKTHFLLFNTSSHTFQGDSCIFRHNENAKNGTMQTCSWWLQNWQCNDENCTFLHPKRPSFDSGSADAPQVLGEENINESDDGIFFIPSGISEEDNETIDGISSLSMGSPPSSPTALPTHILRNDAHQQELSQKMKLPSFSQGLKCVFLEQNKTNLYSLDF